MYSFIVCEPELERFTDVSELLYTDQGDLIEAVTNFMDKTTVALTRKYGRYIRVYKASDPEEIDTPRNVINAFRAVNADVTCSWRIKIKIDTGLKSYSEKAYMFEVER